MWCSREKVLIVLAIEKIQLFFRLGDLWSISGQRDRWALGNGQILKSRVEAPNFLAGLKEPNPILM